MCLIDSGDTPMTIIYIYIYIYIYIVRRLRALSQGKAKGMCKDRITEKGGALYSGKGVFQIGMHSRGGGIQAARAVDGTATGATSPPVPGA